MKDHFFRKLVEEKFKDWVMETNNQRQLDDLGQKKNVSNDAYAQYKIGFS